MKKLIKMNINSSTDTKEKRYKCFTCGRKRFLKYLKIDKIYDFKTEMYIEKYVCKKEVAKYSYILGIKRCNSMDKTTAVKMS